jgi:RNA ligase (TIGR02306 family)
MRKLATIRIVNEIIPIAEANQIECIKIDGWQTVSRKGTFKPNDICIFFEVDSILSPFDPRYEFLRTSSYRKTSWFEGMRLKTIRLKKCISQGIALPFADFPELSDCKVGDDITERLHVQLYDPPVAANLQGFAKGNVPSIFSKSDLERIQNHPEFFDAYKDAFFEISEKLDGTASYYFLMNNDYGVCSHNISFKLDCTNSGNTYIQMGEQYMLEKILRAVDEKFHLGNIMIQGEVYGESIQSNRLKIKGKAFAMYNFYSTKMARYLDFSERSDIERYILLEVNPEFRTVPVIDIVQFFNICYTMDLALAYADRKSMITPSCMAEGIVCKSLVQDNGWLIQFKVLNNNYLLKEE